MKVESKIHDIIYSKMNELLQKMLNDFDGNYKNKANNWILFKFDSSIIANMVFVSSFESKYGNMFEEIAREITKITYGEENVPDTIKGQGISDEEYEDYLKTFNKSGQYVISKFDKKENDGYISQFRADRKSSGRGKNRTPSSLKQDVLRELLEDSPKYSENIVSQPVDLLFYDSNMDEYNIFEIKAGGDLDSSNAPKNVEKLLKIYASLGKYYSKAYFATLYNKQGEGNHWTGVVKGHLNDDLLLISKDFWEKILGDVSFDEFKDIYQCVFEELGFNTEMKNLITKTAQD